jgi:hypothetical protein
MTLLHMSRPVSAPSSPPTSPRVDQRIPPAVDEGKDGDDEPSMDDDIPLLILCPSLSDVLIEPVLP